MDLLAGAAIGAVAGEVLKAVLEAKRQSTGFKSTFERLETTLRSVTVYSNRIQDLNQELDRPSWEMSDLLAQLEQGKGLIAKCSNVSRWNYPQKLRLSKRILKLDESLRRFFNMDMQLVQTTEIKEIMKQVTLLSLKLDSISQSITSVGLPVQPLELPPTRGQSSSQHFKAARLSFSGLAAATNNFASDNKLGSGGFGTVYWGKLAAGGEVAIKRLNTGKASDATFESELALLSRPQHEHLVRLVGYCEEKGERLLVYEYMKNGALDRHLHGAHNVERNSSIINSWRMRIKVSLDAARGIDYLHNYAVPPIIHRDIKPSNILLDANWTAKVSDFGLSLIEPESDHGHREPMMPAGTVGYIDPEYYGLQMFTSKSDVYGLGVVLLELLTGKKAIFRDNGGTPVSVVDYAVPAIMAGELGKVLDVRVGKPEPCEGEAVELVAYTAMHCVSLEGQERPSVTDIVATLERALVLCEDNSHGSISSGGITVISE